MCQRERNNGLLRAHCWNGRNRATTEPYHLYYISRVAAIKPMIIARKTSNNLQTGFFVCGQSCWTEFARQLSGKYTPNMYIMCCHSRVQALVKATITTREQLICPKRYIIYPFITIRYYNGKCPNNHGLQQMRMRILCISRPSGWMIYTHISIETNRTTPSQQHANDMMCVYIAIGRHRSSTAAHNFTYTCVLHNKYDV